VIVDFHTHVFPPGIRRDREAVFGEEPYFAELYRAPRARLAGAEDLLDRMDRDGIDRAVALNFGWSGLERCRQTNEYLLEAAARSGGRIVPFCMVPPAGGTAALRELERCAAAGARGLGEVMPDGPGFPLDGPEWAEIAAAARALGLIVLTHASEPVGHTYPGKGRVRPEVLMRFVAAWPGLRIVLGHWGGGLPFYTLMPEVEAALADTYFDSAASPFLYRDAVFAAVVGMAGAGRVLFGSDFPLLPPARLLRAVRTAGFDAAAEAAILGGNAMRLLGSPGRGVVG
jgi:predicted TIM-barrel fold metal-dependent hydrolase